MAEFRKFFYALGLASLLVGAASTASAQTVQCSGSVANPPIIREEGYTEQVGDYVLDCTGGVSTTSGNTIGSVDIVLTLSAPVTSKLLNTNDVAGGFFNEALLIVDEPNSPFNGHNNRNILSCGDNTSVTNAPYTTTGVCVVTSTGNTANSYDGTQAHPNVFQGRVTPNNVNSITWNGVPFDPPGPASDPGGVFLHRVLRFTNIRVVSPASHLGFPLSAVSMEININGVAVTVTDRISDVANVLKGIDPQSGPGERTDFLQCQYIDGSLKGPIVFREGFASSFKPRNWADMQFNGQLSGGIWVVNPSSTYGRATTQFRQNLPGGLYFTEGGFNAPAGFTNPTTGAPPVVTNPPAGVGSGAPIGGTGVLTNTTNLQGSISTSAAGVADNGTRLVLQFSSVPTGVTINAPPVVRLYRAGTYGTVSQEMTGVAVRVGSPGVIGSQAGAHGDGGIVANDSYGGATLPLTGTTPKVVYEIEFSRHDILEDFVLDSLTITYTPNLPSDLPQTGVTAQVTGGFAPYSLSGDNFFGSAAFGTATVVSTNANPTGGLPIPRFVTQSGNSPLFSLIKCSCNLLFPFVTNLATSNGNFDTGIAIANTSLLPTTSDAQFVTGTGQQGPVQFWYFPSLSTAPPIATQCTNSTTAGLCPGNKVVKAGETLTYVLSGGSSTWGLDNRGAGFTGYMVAHTGFQYCHAFAYISPQGAFPLTNGMSVGYLGLILDKQTTGSDNSLPTRTTQKGEALNQ